MLVPYFTLGLVPHNSVLHLKDPRSKVELQPQTLHWLHILAPCPPFGPPLVSYFTHGLVLQNLVLHLIALEDSQQLGSSFQGLQIGSIIANPGPTLAPY